MNKVVLNWIMLIVAAIEVIYLIYECASDEPISAGSVILSIVLTIGVIAVMVWLKKTYGAVETGIKKIESIRKRTDDGYSIYKQTGGTEQKAFDYKAEGVFQDAVKKPEQKSSLLNIMNKAEYDDYAALVKDTKILDDCLSKFSSEELGRKYVPYIDKYKKAIMKSLKPMDDFDELREDGDIDNIEIAGMVIKPVSRYLADHMIGAYRGINGTATNESEKAFYRAFLQAIEEYLYHIGFKKKELHVNEYITGCETFMEIIPQRTNDPSLYRVIKEIERQPYYINALDGDDPENDDIEKIYLEGRCTVYVEQ